MKAHRILTWPLSLIWSLVLNVRHGLFDIGILSSKGASVPSIVVGNLAFGGTGKTPHVLWLSDHLSHSNVAVLSRGHGRNTRGFLKVTSQTADQVGDEPLLMSLKNKQVDFFVGEDRRLAADKILQDHPTTELLILDDAFQHRPFQGTLNIILTTWHRPYSADCLVPCGRLRDLKRRASKAQIVIVTKCPKNVALNTAAWRKKLKLHDSQSLYFTTYKTNKPIELVKNFAGPQVELAKNAPIVVVMGIAEGKSFAQHVATFHSNVEVATFKDHHAFSTEEISTTLRKFANFAHGQKWIVTTEKDAVRLLPFLDQIHEADVRVAMLPIEVQFVQGEEQFKNTLTKYVG